MASTPNIRLGLKGTNAPAYFGSSKTKKNYKTLTLGINFEIAKRKILPGVNGIKLFFFVADDEAK